MALVMSLVPAVRAQSFFGQTLEGTLCRAGETVMFACPSDGKKIAVCAAPAQDSPFGVLRYRFGDDRALALEFPRTPAPLDSYASGNALGDGERGTLTYLRLVHGDTSYTVFFEAVAPTYQHTDAQERGGVIVEKQGKLLGKRMCDAQARVYIGMMSDPAFFGVAVPRDRHGLNGFPAYRP